LNDLFSAETIGMVRRDDHASSLEAANTVNLEKENIRNRVREFARSRGALGFIDDDLVGHFDAWDTPSSYRKRRSELYAEGDILKTTARRPNRNGINTTVWVHHYFRYDPAVTVSPKRESPKDVELMRYRRFVAEIMERTPNGEYIRVQFHPNGDWSVAAEPET
jgi:hypothetical protein